MRIALAATLAIVAVWFVALRPKPEEIAPLPDPAPVAQAAPKTTTKPETKAAETAKAKKASPADATKARPKPDADTPARSARADRVKAVLADLEARKIVVLLFWMPNGSDDQEVRRAVRSVDRRGGKVAVHVAPISQLADYEPITAGVPVVGTPTTLVIDRKRQARTITGLTLTAEIDQRVTKALRVSR